MIWIKDAHRSPRGEAGMERFVHRQNLEHFRKQLAEETDEGKRQTLLKLLAEEETKDGGRKRKQAGPKPDQQRPAS